jgi:hypothetical protein
MSHRVTRGADGRPRIELEDEPAYCTALQAAPAGREPELDAGLWLVLTFATWSVPDVNAVQTALDVAKHFEGTLKLGLRPFDYPEEHAAWCGDLAGEDASPLWVLLRDGRLCMKLAGSATPEDMVVAIERSLPCAGQDERPT